MTDSTPDRTRGMAVPAAVLTAAAGAVHLGAAVPHFTDSGLLGIGFVVTGLSQVVLAMLLARRRPSQSLLVAGMAVHVVAITAWALSRTFGLPIGHAGPEQIGLPGLVTVAFEVISIGILFWTLTRGRTWVASRRVAVGTLAAVALLAVGGTTSAIAGLATGHGHDEGARHADEGARHADEGARHDDEGARHADEGARHDDEGAGHDDEGAGHDDTGDHVDTEPAANESPVTSASADVGLLHRHADATLHLHVRGDVHVHEDGSLHLHAPRPLNPAATTAPQEPTPAATPAPPTPAEEDQPAASDGPAVPDEDHTHAPGDEH